MKALGVVLLVACVCTFGEDAPATMTKFVVKRASPETPKDSFAAQPKRMYRAGSRYGRIDENPDLEHGIHGLMIINEPDIWLVNRLTKTANHIVDEGPTFDCRMPIFANAEDVTFDEGLKKPENQLEFGQEMEYFLSRSGAPTPGPDLQGTATMAYAVNAGNSHLFLFTGGDPEAPSRSSARMTRRGKSSGTRNMSRFRSTRSCSLNPAA